MMAHRHSRKIHSLACRVALLYLAAGFIWIMASDALLSATVADLNQFEHISTYKGFAFVLVTAALLYLLIRNTFREQRKLEQSLIISEERWKFALEGAGEGVWDWNLETDEVFRSGQWFKIYGYSQEDVGVTAADGRQLMHPEDVSRATEEMNAHLEGKTPIYSSEYRLRCKDGSWKWILSRGMIVSRCSVGKPIRMIGTHTDISERKRSEEEIFRLAHYDKVTGLANRVLFHDNLQQNIEITKRSGNSLALMYLDLDRFKEVNDTLGHDVGDLLLRSVADRLRGCVRASDIVARLGGDEFTILLTNQHNPADIEHIAQEVLRQLSQPFPLGVEELYVSASIGITVAPEDAVDAETLLKNADQAMYAAKTLGGNCFHFFTPSMQETSLKRMHITADLRVAIAQDQFELYYQPIVELASGRINKAEALIRWIHPTKGLVSPAEFISIAEEKGLIVEIGDQIFVKAADQALQWRRQLPGFQLSINKSPVQLKQTRANRMDWLSYLHSLKLGGDAIIVEITEGVLLDANDTVISRLNHFHQAGIQIAIDDFGTGYSSLAYIKKFHVSFVKIDQSFTKGLKPGADDLALCEAIIVMAHTLGMKVIAEGVETEQQHALLLEAGCDYGQGYFYSQPLPVYQFENFLFSGTSERIASSVQ